MDEEASYHQQFHSPRANTKTDVQEIFSRRLCEATQDSRSSRRYHNAEERDLKALIEEARRHISRLHCAQNELAHEEELETFCFDSSLPLTLIPRVEIPKINEKLMVLKVMKSMNQSERMKKYFITPRGTMSSLRMSTKGGCFLGRAKMDEFGQVINDIILPQNDISASRCHCKIQYKKALAPKESLLIFTKLLLCLRRKKIKIPRHILLLIFRMIKPESSAFIKDLNSLGGTYLRISSERFHVLKPFMMFLLSPNTLFSVKEIYPSVREFIRREKALRPELNNCSIQEVLQEVFKHQLPVFGAYVGDADTFVSIYFEKPCINIIILYGDPSNSLSVEQEYIIPCDDLSTQSSKDNADRLFSITVGPENSNALLNIKRSECSFEISYSYQNKVWRAREIGGSFGLWCSVGGSKIQQGRFAKAKMEIKSGDEVKISGTTIKVMWPFYWNGKEFSYGESWTEVNGEC